MINQISNFDKLHFRGIYPTALIPLPSILQCSWSLIPYIPILSSGGVIGSRTSGHLPRLFSTIFRERLTPLLNFTRGKACCSKSGAVSDRLITFITILSSLDVVCNRSREFWLFLLEKKRKVSQTSG